MNALQCLPLRRGSECLPGRWLYCSHLLRQADTVCAQFQKKHSRVVDEKWYLQIGACSDAGLGGFISKLPPSQVRMFRCDMLGPGEVRITGLLLGPCCCGF
jgi:hypothetical protein